MVPFLLFILLGQSKTWAFQKISYSREKHSKSTLVWVIFLHDQNSWEFSLLSLMVIIDLLLNEERIPVWIPLDSSLIRSGQKCGEKNALQVMQFSWAHSPFLFFQLMDLFVTCHACAYLYSLSTIWQHSMKTDAFLKRLKRERSMTTTKLLCKGMMIFQRLETAIWLLSCYVCPFCQDWT